MATGLVPEVQMSFKADGVLWNLKSGSRATNGHFIERMFSRIFLNTMIILRMVRASETLFNGSYSDFTKIIEKTSLKVSLQADFEREWLSVSQKMTLTSRVSSRSQLEDGVFEINRSSMPVSQSTVIQHL